MDVPFGPQERTSASLKRSWRWAALLASVVVVLSTAHPVANGQSTPTPSTPAAGAAAVSAVYVTVYGEVKRPGRYELHPDERVGVTILRAGGFTSRAKPYVKVIRKVPGKGNVTVVVDLKDLMAGKTPARDIPLLPNDTVIVEEKLLGF
jgi:hypothetical protein